MAELPAGANADRSSSIASFTPDQHKAFALHAETPGTVEAPSKPDSPRELLFANKSKLPSARLPLPSMHTSRDARGVETYSFADSNDSRCSIFPTDALRHHLVDAGVATPGSSHDPQVPGKPPSEEWEEGRESSISLARLVDPSDDVIEQEERKPQIGAEDIARFSDSTATDRGEPAKLAARSGKLNEDARKLAVAYAIHSQLGCRRVAKDLDIPLSSVKRYLREFKVSESSEDGEGGARRRKIPDEQMAEIKWWVEHFPKPNLTEDKDKFAKKRRKDSRDAAGEDGASSSAAAALGALVSAAAGHAAAQTTQSTHASDKEQTKAAGAHAAAGGAKAAGTGAAGGKAAKFKPDFPPEGSFAYRVLDVQFNTSTAGTTSDKFGFLEMLVAFCDEENKDLGAKWVSMLEMGHGHYDFLLYDLLKEHGFKVEESSGAPGRVVGPQAPEVVEQGGAEKADPERRKKMTF